MAFSTQNLLFFSEHSTLIETFDLVKSMEANCKSQCVGHLLRISDSGIIMCIDDKEHSLGFGSANYMSANLGGRRIESMHAYFINQ